MIIEKPELLCCLGLMMEMNKYSNSMKSIGRLQDRKVACFAA